MRQVSTFVSGPGGFIQPTGITLPQFDMGIDKLDLDKKKWLYLMNSRTIAQNQELYETTVMYTNQSY